MSKEFKGANELADKNQTAIKSFINSTLRLEQMLLKYFKIAVYLLVIPVIFKPESIVEVSQKWIQAKNTPD